jgi:hypothetical protein
VSALRQSLQQQKHGARNNQPYVTAHILLQNITICISEGILAMLNISTHHNGRGRVTTMCFIPNKYFLKQNQLLTKSG